MEKLFYVDYQVTCKARLVSDPEIDFFAVEITISDSDWTKTISYKMESMRDMEYNEYDQKKASKDYRLSLKHINS